MEPFCPVLRTGKREMGNQAQGRENSDPGKKTGAETIEQNPQHKNA